MSDLGGFGISRATLHVPRWGVPMATVTILDTDSTLVVGAAATLTIGDLAMVGTLRPGDTFGGTTSYTWVGGGGGWGAPIAARSYGDPGGLPRSRLVSDLGKEAGERGPILAVSDGSVGTSWARPAGLARDALDALSPHEATAPNMGGQWWVGADGVTIVGPRRATSTTPQTMSVEAYDPSTLRARVAFTDDAIAQVFPGATVTAAWVDGNPMSTFTVGSLVVNVSDDAITVDLCGERGAAELFADLIAALTAYTRWHAAYPFQASSPTTAQGETSVDPLNALSAALPGLPMLKQWPGVPGMTAMLAKGAPIAVVFLGGSPGGAVIAGYGPGVLPDALTFAATTSIALNTPGVTLGGAAGLGAPVLTDPFGVLTQWFDNISATFASLGRFLPPPTGFVSTTTKAVL